MANAPIQVILNADNYRRDRITQRPNSAGTDFFEGSNEAFSLHRDKLQVQVRNIAERLAIKSDQYPDDQVGYVKVTMRAQALAKSHRPIDRIFPPKKIPLMGGAQIGEMISAVNETSIRHVMEAIEKAEITVRERVNSRTNELEPNPSRYRCEVSAIENIELWSKQDRRRFDIQEAIAWLSNPKTGHAYIVELFERPLLNAQRDAIAGGKRRMFETFEAGLKAIGPGLIAKFPRKQSPDSIFIEISLTVATQPAAIFLQPRTDTRAYSDSEIIFDNNTDRHRELLGFLEMHPLVKEIYLPGIVTQSSTETIKSPLGKRYDLPPPGSGTYPKIGVIDGGVSSYLNPWVIYRHGFLASAHSDQAHGTFISGLLTSAKSLNSTLRTDFDGCLIADLDLYPDENNPNLFEKYYSGGTSDFFDEVEAAIQLSRSQYAIRIFNLSINIVSPVSMHKYSREARRLDQIAQDNDVIIVISAGNLKRSQMRNEWPGDDTQAATILASHINDQLFIPAESIRNLSVSAINPSNLTNSIDGALSRYSRRGPGLRSGVKPDLCHVGGSGTLCPTHAHGLNSVDISGNIISGCGTSYAAPLVAKTLANLDANIEGEPSRETLIALAVHHARLPLPVSKKPISGIAKQLVGFGQPLPAVEALESADHEITLLFSSRIFNKKTLEFNFSWPPSLVTDEGKCKGEVRLTLVSTPPIDYQFGEELIRANIEAALQQEQKSGKYKSELDPTYVFFSDDEKTTEASLIEHKFKWSPIKAFDTSMPKGRGTSSNWRLAVNYLTRANEDLPEEGVPFTVLLTISDPDKQKPVFNEMRQNLQASGIKTADIRTAARVSPRV